MNSTSMDQDQKTTALNNGVQELNDALAALTAIAGVPGIHSTLSFG